VTDPGLGVLQGVVAQLARAPGRQPGGRRFNPGRSRHAPVVKRRSCRTTNPVVKVRVLPGVRKVG
jgi:hypothetical protein